MKTTLFLGALFMFLIGIPISFGAYYNASFPYCNNFTINNQGSPTNITVQWFNITNTSGFANANYSDLHFINDSCESNKTKDLYYHIINYTANATIYGYVNVESIPNNTVVTIAYIYGNNSILGNNNGKLVYTLFDDFNDANLNTSIWKNTSAIPTNTSSAWMSGTGAWREFWSNDNFTASYSFIANASITSWGVDNNMMGWQNALGGSSGGWTINSFQSNYPTAGKSNYRNYISGENSLSSGLDTTTHAIYEIMRNASNVNQSYRIGYNNPTNFSGAQITTTTRPIRVSVITSGQTWNIGWIAVRPYAFPEPIVTYGAQESNVAVPLNTIKETMIICFKTQPICIKLPDGQLFRDTNVIV